MQNKRVNSILCAILLGGLLSACTTAPQNPIVETDSVMQVPVEALNTPVPTTEAEVPPQEDGEAFEFSLHKERRKHVAPLVGNIVREEHGDWSIDTAASAADAQKAIAAALPICNALFGQSFTAEQLQAVYYKDNTGNRANVWRISSEDDALVAAMNADTLTFISADCMVVPYETTYNSAEEQNAVQDVSMGAEVRDSADVIKRLTDILGGKAVEVSSRAGTIASNRADSTGFNMVTTIAVQLADGGYYLANFYGDALHTLDSVGVCPDLPCMKEHVYWRADLEMAEDVIVQVKPQDFQKGEPSSADMTEQQVYDFYYKLVLATNATDGAAPTPMQEPNLTFFVDHSGVRENYWHVEGNVSGAYLIFNIAADTGHIFDLWSDQALGFSMGLMEIPYAQMGNDVYIEATRKLFAMLFGKDSVKDVMLNAVYDGHYCTVDSIMRDGTAYEVKYLDGRIIGITFYSAQEESGWGTNPDWEADWLYINTETGETFYKEW